MPCGSLWFFMRNLHKFAPSSIMHHPSPSFLFGFDILSHLSHANHPRLSCHQKEFDLASSDASDVEPSDPAASAAPSTPKVQPAVARVARVARVAGVAGHGSDDEMVVISALVTATSPVSPVSPTKFAFAQRCRRMAEAKSPKVKSPKVKKARLEVEGANSWLPTCANSVRL